MRNLKLIVSLVLVGVVVVFVVQNAEMVGVEFLGWSFQTPRALLIFGVLGVGVGVGWILRGSKPVAEHRTPAPRQRELERRDDSESKGDGPAK